MVTCIPIFASACAKKQFEGITLNDVTVAYSQSGQNVTIVGKEKYPNATFTLSEDKIDVGVYTQTLTVSQPGYEDFVTTAGSLVPGKNEVATATNVQLTYNGISTLNVKWTGEPIILGVNTNYEQRDLATIAYYQNGVLLNSYPVEVGEYTVVVTLPEVSNYNAVTKTFTFTIHEIEFLATFKVLNPVTNEIESASTDGEFSTSYIKNTNFIVPYEFDVSNKFEGYIFIGWFIDDAPINETYDYNKDVIVVAKYQKI